MATDGTKGSDIMADLSDVLTAVYNQVVVAVYPTGTSNPSVAGVTTTIIQGWPIKNKLDDALKLGQAMVSIFPTSMEKPITVFERVNKDVSITAPTIDIVIDDLTITFSGTISTPQSIILTIDNVTYQYTILGSDTLDIIATNMAAMIPGASAAGAVITLASGYGIIANIATQATSALELGRQERQFMICCWCPTPAIRALLGPAIDNYMRINYQFPIAPDNFNIMIFYDRTNENDDLQIPLIYKRDLYYKIQYSTTQLNNFTTIAKTITNYTITPGGLQ
jgi:hypothetical protein